MFVFTWIGVVVAVVFGLATLSSFLEDAKSDELKERERKVIEMEKEIQEKFEELKSLYKEYYPPPIPKHLRVEK